MRNEDGSGGTEVRPHRVHLTLTGTAVMSPARVGRLGRADRLGRLVYNAVVDAQVPFPVGLPYRLALDGARRTGRPEPEEPARSETFLPVPTPFGLGPELTALLRSWPVLRSVPRTMLNNAVAEGCRARKAHVKACGEAKAAGRRLPHLRFRSADDGWSVSTDSFQILRIGDGDPARLAKKQDVTAVTLKNRSRRDRKKERRETDWAAERRRKGWTERRIAAGLAKRAAKQAADRARNEARRETREKIQVGTVRRDSPRAIVGARRMKVDVLGIGRFRIDLGREVPPDAGAVRITLVKPSWRGAKVEVRVVLSVPEEIPAACPLEAGRRLHEALCELPEDASPLAAVEAVRAAGLLVRGEDLGSSNASTDDTGHATPPVRIPRRADFRQMKRLQEELAHKRECAKRGGFGGLSKRKARRLAGKGGDEAVAAAVARSEAGLATARQRQEAKAAAVPVAPAGSSVPTTVPRRGPRRSVSSRKVQDVIRRMLGKAADLSRTRALQDAARLMRPGPDGTPPLLVATDPRRMVRPLLAKGGPAERKTRREKKEGTGKKGTKVADVTVVARVSAPADGPVRDRDDARARGLRRNLHGTRLALRIDRLEFLAVRAGTVFVTPGHEGTSSTCPSCRAVEKKPLSLRRHDCPCGLSLPRDHASALETLGRALLSFRVSPDPGGLIAAGIAERKDAREKAEAARTRKSERATKAAERRRETKKAGVPPGGRAVVSPVPPSPGPAKRVRGQGRNVGRRSAGS